MNVASISITETLLAANCNSFFCEKITIRNLNFYYGPSKALKARSLAHCQHEVTAFIGPSGCGKSTLLRILNRMYDLYPHQRATGDVRIDNEQILSPSQDLNLLPPKV